MADHEGNVLVRFCGCPGHGILTLWEMHSHTWRAQHLAEARRAIGDAHERVRKGGVPQERTRFVMARINTAKDTPRTDPNLPDKGRDA